MSYRFLFTICMLTIVMVSGRASAQDIVLGQSAALSGPAQELGREMQLGAKTYFDLVNAAGGIRGRKIVLRTDRKSVV